MSAITPPEHPVRGQQPPFRPLTEAAVTRDYRPPPPTLVMAVQATEPLPTPHWAQAAPELAAPELASPGSAEPAPLPAPPSHDQVADYLAGRQPQQQQLQQEHQQAQEPQLQQPKKSTLQPSAQGGRPRRRDRAKEWLAVAAALAIIAASMLINRGELFVVPVLFVLVVPFEKLFPRHSQRIRRPQVGTDIGYALAGPLLSAVGVAAAVVVAVVSLAWLPGLAVRPLVAMIPPAVAPLVGIALFDLAIYWTHRWYHEVPVLWRFHAVHHSPEHMDWVSGFRNHPFDGTLIAPAFVFLLAAGFSAEFTGALAVIQIVLGIFLHANVRWRLRPLHRLIITPEFHHWHHANEPGAINSNYSVFLPAWDILFGTYFMPRRRRPQVYGISEYMPTGMVAQLWHPLRGMGNPLRVLRHPIRSLGGMFRFTRRLLGEMKRSAKRPRRRSAEDLGPDFRPQPQSREHQAPQYQAPQYRPGPPADGFSPVDPGWPAPQTAPAWGTAPAQQADPPGPPPRSVLWGDQTEVLLDNRL